MAVNDLGTVHIARQVQAVRIQNEIVSSDFMRILIDWCIPSIVSQANGLIPGLKRELLLNLILPIPPRCEQDRIVSTLSCALAILKRFEEEQTELERDNNLHYEGELPNGWALCRLDDILDYEQPQAYIVSSTEYSNTYKTPVLTPGKSFVLGYTNEMNGVCNHLPVIIFDDFTTESKYVDFPFKVKSSAMKILRARGDMNLKYVALFMSIVRLTGDTHKRYWISEYSKIPIPVPPLRDQERIVSLVNQIFNQLDHLITNVSDD